MQCGINCKFSPISRVKLKPIPIVGTMRDAKVSHMTNFSFSWSEPHTHPSSFPLCISFFSNNAIIQKRLTFGPRRGSATCRVRHVTVLGEEAPHVAGHNLSVQVTALMEDVVDQERQHLLTKTNLEWGHCVSEINLKWEHCVSGMHLVETNMKWERCAPGMAATHHRNQPGMRTLCIRKAPHRTQPRMRTLCIIINHDKSRLAVYTNGNENMYRLRLGHPHLFQPS